MWLPLKRLKDELFELKRWTRLIFSYPKMDIKKVDYDEYWKSKRGVEIGRLSDWQKNRADIILESIESNSSILDIGCGDGSILTYIKSKIKTGELYGADSSSLAINNLKDIKGFQIDISSIDSLKFLPDADYVFLLEILEHVVNPEEVLNTLYDKAKKGVFFSFPNTGFIIYRLRLLLGKVPMQWRLHPSEHVRFWTYRDLVWWLDQLGYTGEINFYKGFPILNKIMPSLFAAAFVVEIKKKI